MARIFTDPRQLALTAAVNAIGSSANTPVDSLLSSIDSELTPPFQMRLSSVTDIIVYASAIQNPITSRYRTVHALNREYTAFTSATIATNGTSSKAITITGGTGVTVTATGTQYQLVGVNINADTGAGLLTIGTAAASIAAAGRPETPYGYYGIGYFVVQSSGSGVADLASQNIYQYQTIENNTPINSNAYDITGAYTILPNDGYGYFFVAAGQSGSATITLPPIASSLGRIIHFSTSPLQLDYTLTIDGHASETIGGSLTSVNLLNRGATLSLYGGNNGYWEVIDGDRGIITESYNSDRVGILTRIPTYTLDVAGVIRSTDYVYASTASSASTVAFAAVSSGTGLYAPTSNTVGLAAGTSTVFEANITSLAYIIGAAGTANTFTANLNSLTFESSVSSTIVSLTRGVNQGGLLLSGSAGNGGRITLYGSGHATLANRTVFENAGTTTGSISSAGLWTIGASASTQLHVINGDAVIMTHSSSTGQYVIYGGQNAGIFEVRASTGGSSAGILLYPQGHGTLASITVFRNSSNNTGQISAAGDWTIGRVNTNVHVLNTTTATSATAGASGAVPAQVQGYVTITINGSSRRIPYFNP